MAFLSIEKSEDHLVDRAKGRFSQSGKEARKHIYRIKEEIEKLAPVDWRFTKSPVAKFLIWDERTDFRILGRSYRNVGKELLGKLREASLSDEFSQLVDEYLNLVQKPDSQIYHELKTILSRSKEITELKHSYRLARIFLPHVIPIDAKRIATRPNAILTKEHELWVRQNEFLTLGGEKIEYLLFKQLTPKGIDKSKVRIYIHDRQGNVKFENIIHRAFYPVYLEQHDLPEEFRTASYWSLPTYVDAEYMDLLYKRDNQPAKVTPEEALLLLRIKILHSEARNRLNLPYLDKEISQILTR